MRRVALGQSLRRVLLGTLATSVLVGAAAPALAAGEKPINLPAGTLEQSLAALSAQTGDQLVYPLELVAGRPAPALSGRYTTEDALRRLFAAGTIDARRTGPRVVVLKLRRTRAAAAPAANETSEPRPFEVASAGGAEPIATANGAPLPAGPHMVAEVRVTGTHIRGGSPAAPVLVVDQVALERSGDHGPREGVFAGAFGRTWASGHVLFAYEGYRREALTASQRRFTASADLRPLGGTDHRDSFSYPGNVVRTDPVTAAIVPFWAIPANSSGVGLRPSDFQADVVNRFNQNQGLDVLPDQRRHSAYLSWAQDLSSTITLSGDVRYGFRRARTRTPPATSTLTVGRNNPFFVSPNGAATNQIQYSFGGLAPNPLSEAGVESWSGSLGGEAQAWGDWRVEGYVAGAQEIIETTQTGGLHSGILAEALGNAADNPATAYSAARDGFFNPYASIAAGNSPTTVAAITSAVSKSRYRSQVGSANLQADGTLFRLPSGPVRAALGLQARRETFRSRGSSYASSPAPAATRPFTEDRTVTSAFAEVQAPLIGDDASRPLLQRLEVSAAVRAERYSDFGTTVNPRFGLQWTPMTGLLVRATYGESYRAPALFELYNPQSFATNTVTRGTERIRNISKLGGNPDLGPETAKSWTIGFDLAPGALPGARLAVTAYETKFKDRIDRPLVSAPRGTILTDPAYAPFVRLTSAATNPADFAALAELLSSPLFNPQLGVFAPTDYGAILDQRYVNTAGLTVRGVDAQASYARDAVGGRLTVAANGAWMLDFQRAVTPAASFREFVGDVGNPARFRGRLTADWTRGMVSLGAALNHTSGFEDALGETVRAQDTVDLSVRVTAPDTSRWSGVSAVLNVRNLFDRAPPFYDNPTGFGFDATNGDVVGRFVSLQISKRW